MNIGCETSSRIWGGVKTWMPEFGNELRHRGDEVFFFGRDRSLVDAFSRLQVFFTGVPESSRRGGHNAESGLVRH